MEGKESNKKVVCHWHISNTLNTLLLLFNVVIHRVAREKDV